MGELAQPDVAACIAQASALYRADGARVLAQITARGGKHGEIRVLPNGEVEIGLARIPGRDAAALQKNGITARALADDDCLNVTIATYLIQLHALEAASPATAAQAPGAAMTAAAAATRSAPGDSPTKEACLLGAAARYHLPVELFRAVIKTEGGWNGLKQPNTNGSFDMGLAQINTIHLPELAKFGITAQQVINDPCTNLHVAAYRLRFEINRVEDLWRGVGNYHSRTPRLNLAYQGRVRKHLARIMASVSNQ